MAAVDTIEPLQGGKTGPLRAGGSVFPALPPDPWDDGGSPSAPPPIPPGAARHGESPETSTAPGLAGTKGPKRPKPLERPKLTEGARTSDSPVADSRKPPHPHRPRRVTRAAYLAILTLGACLWYFTLATLLVSRGVALASGWQVTTIVSGSMSPALDLGDLVAYDMPDLTDRWHGMLIGLQDRLMEG